MHAEAEGDEEGDEGHLQILVSPGGPGAGPGQLALPAPPPRTTQATGTAAVDDDAADAGMQAAMDMDMDGAGAGPGPAAQQHQQQHEQQQQQQQREVTMSLEDVFGATMLAAQEAPTQHQWDAAAGTPAPPDGTGSEQQPAAAATAADESGAGAAGNNAAGKDPGAAGAGAGAAASKKDATKKKKKKGEAGAGVVMMPRELCMVMHDMIQQARRDAAAQNADGAAGAAASPSDTTIAKDGVCSAPDATPADADAGPSSGGLVSAAGAAPSSSAAQAQQAVDVWGGLAKQLFIRRVLRACAEAGEKLVLFSQSLLVLDDMQAMIKGMGFVAASMARGQHLAQPQQGQAGPLQGQQGQPDRQEGQGQLDPAVTDAMEVDGADGDGDGDDDGDVVMEGAMVPFAEGGAGEGAAGHQPPAGLFYRIEGKVESEQRQKLINHFNNSPNARVSDYGQHAAPANIACF